MSQGELTINKFKWKVLKSVYFKFDSHIRSPPSTSKEIHPMGEPPKKKFDTGEKKTIVIINYQKILSTGFEREDCF
jgi:hypothetical protein